MAIIGGGLINPSNRGGGSSSTQLALSDGLACYTGSFSGVTTTQFSHGLGTTYVIPEFKDSAGNLLVPNTWQVLSSNVLEVEFAAPATGDVTIIGCIESGLAPITGGVTTIEGLSGVVDVDSPNGSILISTSGQILQLNALFTAASGAILQQHIVDLITLSGLIGSGGGGSDAGQTSINGLSGVVTLTSPNSSIGIGDNGQSIELSGIFTWASGQALEQRYREIDSISGLTVQNTSDILALGNYASGVDTRLVALSGLTDGLLRIQTSVNSLSGAISLTSPDDTILIGINGQAIELSGLFTQASGAVVQQHSTDLLGLSGLTVQNAADLLALGNYASGIDVRLVALSGLTDGLPRSQTSIEGVSGTVALQALDGTLAITVNGQIIELSGLFNPASGQLVDQLAQDVTSVSGAATNKVALAFTPTSGTTFVLEHGLASEDFTFTMWNTGETPRRFVLPDNVYPSGTNHAVVELQTGMSGLIIFVG